MIDQPVRILFVEEDLADQIRVERFIRNLALRCRLDTVSSTAAAIARLQNTSYDIALIDYRFSDGTVFDLLQRLGETPAIFLTEDGQQDIAAMALDRGAYDYLIKDSNRNYLTLLPGTIRKVMERRKTEVALRETEAQFRDLLEVMLDIYFCISEEGTILLVNGGGAKHMGYTAAELAGLPLERFLHPADKERLKRDLLVASSNPGQPQRAEFRLVRKDGSSMGVMAEVRAQPERGRQIPVIRLMCRPIAKKNGATNGHANGHPNGMEKGPQATRVPAAIGTPPPVLTAAAMTRPAAVPGPLGVNDITSEIKGTERLLVVDDSPEHRALTARMLAKLGYRVVTAECGKAAIELLKKSDFGGTAEKPPFDLVVLDMNMDRSTDGLDTYREMLRVFPSQKCIVVSAGCDRERIRTAQALGAGRFVAKPFTFQSLGGAIRTEMTRKRG